MNQEKGNSALKITKDYPYQNYQSSYQFQTHKIAHTLP